jgi:hypothetical protein
MTMPFNHRKPYAVIQVCQMVFDAEGNVIGYTQAVNPTIVSERFESYTEAMERAKELNATQGMPLYRINVEETS